MHLSSVRHGVLALAAVLLVVPATAATAAPSDAVAHSAGSTVTEPEVHACYDLTVKQLGKKSSSVPSVSCNKKHTTITSAVVQLPKGLDWSSSTDDLTAAADKKCYPSFFKQVGGEFIRSSQSTYTFGFFFPTKSQMDGGARWIRCDVYLVSGPTSIQKLTLGTAPLLQRGLTDRNRRCGTAKLTFLSCRHNHTYRSTGAFSVSQKKYPSRAQYAKLVQQGCPRFDRRRTGYGTIQGPLAWSLGDRTITCFRKTTN